jgi:hypothetical protein
MIRPHVSQRVSRDCIAACARTTLHAVLGVGLLLPVAVAADPVLRSFDIPAGDAAVTLKAFAAQSNEQLLYSPDDVRGVQTQAVHGDLPPLTTLEAMLNRTNLRSRQDPATQAIAITLRPEPRVAPEAARPPASSISSVTMKPQKKITLLSAWLAVLLAPGQSASAAVAPTAAQLAKFDVNKNGLLDPAEQAAFEAELKAEQKPEEKNGTVMLNAFEVNTSKDRGYAAGNTLSGGRIDTPLALTPASISVMTKEFMDDFGILDINDAAQFTIGMDLANPNNELPFGGNRNEFSFRGADRAGNYPTRDGIQQYFVADSYNSERFEFSRGPNAQMFGVGGPGGMVGSGSKQARFNSREVSSTFRFDSFGGYRGTMDYNQGFDWFGVRINAVHQNIMTWQDRTSNKMNGLTGQIKFRLGSRTVLTANYERSSESNRQYAKSYSENASLWDRTTVNNNNTQIAGTPSTFGLGIISQNNDRITYNTSTQSLLNYRGFQYQTVGLGYRIPWGGRPDLPNFKPGIDKEFNLGPIDNMAERDNNTRMVTLDHTFSQNLTARLLWNSSDVDNVVPFVGGGGPPSDYRIDVNRLLPNGAANPNFGRAYSDQTQATQAQQNGSDDWTINVNYTFNAPRWWDLKQRLNISGGYRVERFEAWNRSWRWINNPAQLNPTNNVNALVMRYYHDNPGATIKGVVNEQALNALDPTKKWGNIQTGFNLMERTITANGQLSAATSFFDDRLVFSYGGRRDRVGRNQLNTIGNDAANGYAIIQGNTNPATGLQERGFVTKSTTYATSKNVGMVTYPFPNKWKWLRPVGFFVNGSENFQPVSGGNPLLSGKNPEAPYSRTEDFGIRYSIPGGVAYAEVRRYNTKQLGQLGNFGSTGDISNIWINLGYTDIDHTEFGPYRDVSARELSGYEFEVTANPTRNITLTANYSHPSVRTIADSIDRRAYVAANLAEWTAGGNAVAGQVVNGRAILDPAVIRQALRNIDDSFNSSTAGTLGNGARHRASLNGRYSFSEGKLRGTALVLGVTYRGHSKSGSRDARIKFGIPDTTGSPAPTILQNTAAAWDYLWTPPVWTTTAGINYTRRFGKVQARFQLNVSNLLDDDKPQWSGYGVISSGQLTPSLAVGDPNRNPRMQVYNNFNMPEPRKFVFTTTLNF